MQSFSSNPRHFPRFPRLAVNEIHPRATQRNEAHRGGLAGGLSSAKAPPASLSPLRDPRIHLTGKRHLPSTALDRICRISQVSGSAPDTSATCRRASDRYAVNAISEGGIGSAALLDLSIPFHGILSDVYGCVYVWLEDLCVTLDTRGWLIGLALLGQWE